MTAVNPGETVATIPCPDCGALFEQRAILLDGRPLAMTRRCDQCSAAADAAAAARRAAYRQELERDALERAAAMRGELIAAATDGLATPPLYADATLTNWTLHGTDAEQLRQQRIQSAGLRYVAEWPDVHHQVIVLRGGPGTGKGHWAWSVAKAVAALGQAVKVVKLSNLIRELRRGWRGGDADEEVTLAVYRKLDLLVIDEVSRHAFYGEQIHQHLYDVIDERVEFRRPTILTSNETPEGLAEILRAALWSRIHGNGGVLEFGAGPDYRQRRRALPTP